MAFIEKVRIRMYVTDTVMRNVNKIFTAVFVSLMDLQYKLRLIPTFSRSAQCPLTHFHIILDSILLSHTLATTFKIFSYFFGKKSWQASNS